MEKKFSLYNPDYDEEVQRQKDIKSFNRWFGVVLIGGFILVIGFTIGEWLRFHQYFPFRP